VVLVPPPVVPVLVPPPVGVTPPDAVVDEPVEVEVLELGGGATIAGVVPVDAALDDVEVVLVVAVVAVVEVPPEPTAEAPEPSGTVSDGPPLVRPTAEPPPPHADSPAASASPIAAATSLAVMAIRSRAAPCACRSAGSRSDPSAKADRTSCRT
jgi:hypothetical protein